METGAVNRLLVISMNTVREHLREKILASLVVFALLLIASSMLLVRFNLGDSRRLILNLGLASLNFFGTVMAIFIGIGLVSREIDSKTIEAVITKPIRRCEFLMGKYIGLVLTLLLNIFLMMAGILMVLTVMDIPIEPVLYKAVPLIFLELMVVTAVALLFSTFTSATLSAICTLAIYAIGHLLEDFKTLSVKFDSGARVLIDVIFYMLPNLEQFNMKGRVIHRLDISAVEMELALGYGILYTAWLLAIAAIIFQRRDFR
ncbi:ABC transporter permease [Nitrospira sp. Nam80]